MTIARRVAGSGADILLEAWGPSGLDAPPLLMLHGVSRCGRTFAPSVPALAPAWRVHTLDHRGHGGSARGDRYLVCDYAADTRDVVAREFSEPVVIHGHSLGALVAISVAAALPGRVAAIVLEDPPGPSFVRRVSRGEYRPVFELYRRHAGSTTAVGRLAAILADSCLESPQGGPPRRFGDIRDPAAVRLTAACLEHLDPAVFDPLLADAWLDGSDPVADAGKVACPVLLLRGDPALGGMLPDDDFAALAGSFADVTAVDLSAGSPWGRAGHGILSQSPDALARFVLPFLASTAVAATARGA